MGHVRLLVQGQWADLSRASPILVWLGGRSQADHKPRVSYSAAVSVTLPYFRRAARCQDAITEQELAARWFYS